MPTMIEIDGRSYPVTKCPTAFAVVTRSGGHIPPADRQALANHTAKKLDENPGAWMRDYAVKKPMP